MNLSLTPSLEQYIHDKASSGEYNSPSEVIRQAIRLLQAQDEEHALKLERLRSAIKAGDDALKQGLHTSIRSKQDMDTFFDHI